MADTKFIQVNQAVVHVDVQSSFDSMALALKNAKNIAITIEQSYLSEYDLVDELRRLVKRSAVSVPNEIKPLLDPAKDISSIVQENKYNPLKDYISGLAQTDFEPTLASSIISATGKDIYPIPNTLKYDPRRTGRFIKAGPSDVLKSIGIQNWIINNGPLYGFVLYGDFALYYIGFEKIVDQLLKAENPNSELVKIVSQFLKPTSKSLLTTITSKRLLENIPPS